MNNLNHGQKEETLSPRTEEALYLDEGRTEGAQEKSPEISQHRYENLGQVERTIATYSWGGNRDIRVNQRKILIN